jgi:hypothetical protein
MAGVAWAESGIRIKSGPTMVDATNPPCNAERVTTFKVVIENTNCVCNEDVNPIRQAKAVEARTEASPKDSFEFLGFSKSQGGALSPTITFIDMEDESSTDFFFQVKTKPVACTPLGGGDFEKVEFGIVICDSGGGCDWGLSTDPPDPVCESPKHVPVVVLQADTTLCPPSATGTARIQGLVLDSNGAVSLAQVTATKGCRGSPGFVNEDDRTKALPPVQRGTYEIAGLPVGTYQMEVREGGRCAAASITIGVDGETKVQNFTLPGVPAVCP